MTKGIHPRITRRTFLQVGTLAWPGLLPSATAESADSSERPRRRSKSCILLFMTGGPAQQETFDPKPEADTAVRGIYDPIATSVPGIEICELLPMLAKNAHRYSIIRSTYHNSGTWHRRPLQPDRPEERTALAWRAAGFPRGPAEHGRRRASVARRR